MKNIPTYENDKDLEPLLFGELTEEKVLRFFFKKNGRVNWNNFSYCVSEYGKKQVAHILKELEGRGLIKHTEYPMMKVTYKAKWERIRDNKTIIAIGVICGILGFLILVLQMLHIL
jgi:hypothetical protein